MFQDLRYGVRMLLKSKGLTAVALLSLALGIGANTALFSVADAMQLRSLAVPNPRELILFKFITRKSPPDIPQITFDGVTKDSAGLSHYDAFSYRVFERFKANNHTLSHVFAFARIYRLRVIADGNPELLTGASFVSGNYFSGLGVNAIRGRTIREDDDTPTAPPVAVIGFRYWERRFGLDPSAVGKSVDVNGVPLTIIGVAPRGFSGTMQVDDSPALYIPMALEPVVRKSTVTNNSALDSPEHWWLQIMGRPSPGIGAEQIRADFEGQFQQAIVDARVGQPQPAPEALHLEVASGTQGQTTGREEIAQSLLVLTILMVLILFIACTNVANLLLARAAARQKEVATRLSVGATPMRLFRQLVTESLLLALIGGGLGVVFAFWAKDMLVLFGPWKSTVQNVEVRIDAHVLGFAAFVSIACGVLFGVVPALRAVRSGMTSAMQENARTIGPGRSVLSKRFLVAQVAMSVVLLIGAGLFVRTLYNLQYVDIGFNPRNLLLFNVDPQQNGYDRSRANAAVEQIIDGIRSIPGVTAVSVSNQSLAGGGFNFFSTTGPDGRKVSASPIAVRANFFEMLGLPFVYGRTFSPEESATGKEVVVISETLARSSFPNESPIGQKVWGSEIVGVVRDAKVLNLRQASLPVIYSPYSRGSVRALTFEVRTSGEPQLFLPAIREAVRRIDSKLPLYAVKTQEDQINQTLQQERVFATLSTTFGVLALFLVCVGLYGIMSYTVTRRTHEIGIRMALGARRRTVMGLVMRETLSLILTGCALGIATVVVLNRSFTPLSRQLDRLLFQLAPNDTVSFASAIVIMITVASLAGYLPARRASRVDPNVALRYE